MFVSNLFLMGIPISIINKKTYEIWSSRNNARLNVNFRVVVTGFAMLCIYPHTDLGLNLELAHLNQLCKEFAFYGVPRLEDFLYAEHKNIWKAPSWGRKNTLLNYSDSSGNTIWIRRDGSRLLSLNQRLHPAEAKGGWNSDFTVQILFELSKPGFSKTTS